MREKLFCILFGFVLLVAMPLIAQTEKDNGAFFYKQALQMMPEFSDEEFQSLRKVSSLEAFKKLSPEVINKLGKALKKEFFGHLSAAQKSADCFFFTEKDYSLKSPKIDTKIWRNFNCFLNAMGWLAISQNKVPLGLNLFAINLSLSRALAKNSILLHSSIFSIAFVKDSLASIESYCETSNDAKGKDFLIKRLKGFPRPFYNVGDFINTERKVILEACAVFDKEPEYLAGFFAAKENPKRKICQSNIRMLTGGIELAQMDGLLKNKEADVDAVQKLLVEKSYMKEVFTCPSGGKYGLIYNDAGEIFEITCSCYSEPLPAHKDPDRVGIAMEYRNSPQYENDKKELLEYLEKLAALDHSAADPYKEMAEYNSENPKYANNVFLIHLMFDCNHYKDRSNELQGRIDTLIKKYEQP